MKLVVAALYTVAAAVLAAIVAGFVANGLTPMLSVVSLCVGFAVGGVSLWSERKQPSEPWQIDFWGGGALIVFALFALRSFLWLAFYSGDGLWVFSPNNLGDFALHLTYVRYFAAGAPFWPENPIFAGEPLTYPVGIDLFNALLALVGVEELRGFIWVALLGSFCTAAMLWRWGRGFVVAAFLFVGGTLGFEIVRRGVFVDYQSDAAWTGVGLVVALKSLPLALFVTQRGLLFAIPGGLALLASWRARFFEPERIQQRLPLWGEWLLYASMPVFHLHTFLFLSFIAAVWFCTESSARRHLASVVGLAVLPATLLVWCVTGRFHGASVLGWLPGWMQGDQNFFTFWLTNFGFWIPLIIALAIVVIWKRGPSSAGQMVFPAMVMFFICCFVKFAPWEWDNTKLMIWSFLLVLPSLWCVLLESQPEWGRAATCFLLFFSGAVSLLGGLSGRSVTESDLAPENSLPENIGYTVAARSEIDGARWAARDIPITDRFVGHPNYNHPLLLSGRLMVMGYEGHLWSHGIDFAARKKLVERVLKGAPDWREAASQLGAQWLFWGEQESRNYADTPQPWKNECRVHASGAWGRIYDLTTNVTANAKTSSGNHAARPAE